MRHRALVSFARRWLGAGLSALLLVVLAGPAVGHAATADSSAAATDTGARLLDGWTLTGAFPDQQQRSANWGGRVTSTGSTVTMTNES